MWYKRKEFTSGLHFWGRGSPRTLRVMMWLAHNDGCVWEAGMDWLPSFHPGVWVFSKQEASVLLIQQPKHTDVCCFPRDHLVVTSKWLGGEKAEFSQEGSKEAFQEQCWEWQEERPHLKAWWKGEFNEGLLGYLIPGQRFILGADGGGTFGPCIGQLLCTSPNVGTGHAWSHVILTRALGMKGNCYVHFTEKKIEAGIWRDLSPWSNG